LFINAARMCSRALIDAIGKIMPPKRIATVQSFSERKIFAAEKLPTWNCFPSRTEKEMLQKDLVRREEAGAVIGRRLNNPSFFEPLECKAASSSAARKSICPALVRWI
jgi:hypothetical protein